MNHQGNHRIPEHPRLRRDRKTVQKMIGIYCNAHHQTSSGEFCPNCQALVEYTAERVERCPYGWRKPTCAKCPIHCYTPVRREEIRTVMRYAGPRMLFRYPGLALLHLFNGLRKPQPKK